MTFLLLIECAYCNGRRRVQSTNPPDWEYGRRDRSQNRLRSRRFGVVMDACP